VPYGALPGLLAGYRALLLPLTDNLYGRALANPLKLWDYLATGLPIVAADLPTVREVAGDWPCYYTVGDASSLAAAVGRALSRGPRAPVLRDWDQRAAEIESFLGEIL
jgi:glycosyltransferase involved in cell wall biosynthesis